MHECRDGTTEDGMRAHCYGLRHGAGLSCGMDAIEFPFEMCRGKIIPRIALALNFVLNNLMARVYGDDVLAIDSACVNLGFETTHNLLTACFGDFQTSKREYRQATDALATESSSYGPCDRKDY